SLASRRFWARIAGLELGAAGVAQLFEGCAQLLDPARAETSLDRQGVVAERGTRVAEQLLSLVRQADQIRPAIVGIRHAFGVSPPLEPAQAKEHGRERHLEAPREAGRRP